MTFYDSDACLTPISEDGIRALFEGFCAMQNTLYVGGFAEAAIAVSPSIWDLIKQFCGNDPRYPDVMSKICLMDYAVMKSNLKNR